MRMGVDYGGDDYSAVTFTRDYGEGAMVIGALTGEPADAFVALIRVATAAYAYDYCNDDDLERKKRLLLEMRNALRDAEHLLGFVTTGA